MDKIFNYNKKLRKNRWNLKYKIKIFKTFRNNQNKRNNYQKLIYKKFHKILNNLMKINIKNNKINK